jgi:hypothetical protein
MMNTKEIKAHLAQLTDKQLTHCNGVDFAYFRTEDIAALVVESEPQTDLLYHLIEMCEVFQNNDDATDDDAYELSKAIIRTVNMYLKGKDLETQGDPNEKKPRLFYYEEGENAFIPAPDDMEILIDVKEQLDDGEVMELQFKRIDLSDNEMAALPECWGRFNGLN